MNVRSRVHIWLVVWLLIWLVGWLGVCLVGFLNPPRVLLSVLDTQRPRRLQGLRLQGNVATLSETHRRFSGQLTWTKCGIICMVIATELRGRTQWWRQRRRRRRRWRSFTKRDAQERCARATGKAEHEDHCGQLVGWLVGPLLLVGWLRAVQTLEACYDRYITFLAFFF